MQDEELSQDELALFAGNMFFRRRKFSPQLIFRTRFLVGFIFLCGYVTHRLGKFIEWDRSSVHDFSQELPSFFANGRERNSLQPLIESSFRTRILDPTDVTKI